MLALVPSLHPRGERATGSISFAAPNAKATYSIERR